MAPNKKNWDQWAELLTKKSGKCPGRIPTFGLPTDLLTEDEFKQVVLGMPLHPVASCDCWVQQNEGDIEEILSGVKEIVGRKLNKNLSSSDSVETMLQLTERNLRERVMVLKEKLSSLVSRISVSDFRVVDKQIVWDLKVPKSLFELFEVINDLKPKHESRVRDSGLVKPYQAPPID